MIEKFESVDIVEIPRSENHRAYIIARIVVIVDPKIPKLVPMKVKSCPNIEYSLEMLQLEQKGSWMDTIILYIRDGELPADKLRAQKIRCQALRYMIINGVLYWRGYTLLFLRYLGKD